MPATTTGAPFSLNVPSASTDAADLFGLYLKPNMTAINTNAAHKGTAQTFSALQTFSAGATVSSGDVTVSSGTIILPAGSASAPSIAPSGDSNTGTFYPAADTIAWATGGSERVRVNSSGNVGIGTSSPSFPLDVQYAVAGNSVAQIYNGTANAASQALFLAKTSGAAGVQIGQTYGASGGSAFVNNLDNGALWFGTNNTERMRITSSGNVGIGTTSPGSALDVKGVVRFSGSTSGYVGLQGAAAAGSTTYTLPSADGAAGTVLSTNGAGTLSWATASGGGGGARAILLMGA